MNLVSNPPNLLIGALSQTNSWVHCRPQRACRGQRETGEKDCVASAHSLLHIVFIIPHHPTHHLASSRICTTFQSQRGLQILNSRGFERRAETCNHRRTIPQQRLILKTEQCTTPANPSFLSDQQQASSARITQKKGKYQRSVRNQTQPKITPVSPQTSTTGGWQIHSDYKRVPSPI
jgi:hypothetical protein